MTVPVVLDAPRGDREASSPQHPWLRRIPLSLIGLVLVFGASVAMRLPELDEPANNYDEGVYLESLLLMARGYQPFREISTSQGPLHLYSQLPLFLAFGQTVEAGRATSVICSLLTLAAIWWIALRLGGPWAGLLAVAMLAASPTYLRFSRQALADIPALASATIAVGMALSYSQCGRRWQLIAAALFLALGALMKPIALPAAIPVAMLISRPGRGGWRDLAALVGLFSAVVGAVLLALGPGLVFDQVLGFRAEARTAYGWSPVENWEALVDKLDQEQLGFYALALVGLGQAALTRPIAILGLTLWVAGGSALLLGHSPLYYHHMVILVPPLAMLGGLSAASLRIRPRPALPARVLSLFAIGALVLYATELPNLVRRDALLLGNVDAAGAGSDNVDDLVSAAERIARLTTADDFVVTDNPYLAFLAHRRVPPELVDPSEARLVSGDLTDEEMLTLAGTYAPRVVVLWNGRFNQLPHFLAWVSMDYRQERSFGAGGSRVIWRAQAAERRATLP